MENSNLNQLLDREQMSNEIKKILLDFDTNCKNINYKKAIYIYGSPGSGKTEFVNNILKELDYDIITYDSSDVRNKTVMDTITSNNISNRNVLQMLSKKVKKIAIVMDDAHSLVQGDRGGITALIKLIRQKKTKKQKMESMTMNPIICIGNYYMDKKIKELMKVCNTFELKTPTTAQINRILTLSMPDMHFCTFESQNVERKKVKMVDVQLKQQILNYIQGDLRKLLFIIDIYKKKPEFITTDALQNIFHTKSYNEDSKKITQMLINRPVKMEEHNRFMNETDRTIVALLWHENIVDVLSSQAPNKSYPFYLKILDNICYADYIDRITFQSQIWQFNEMSSLMKTFYNNKLYHDAFPENKNGFKPFEVRFTKVLTKYSTEYNNMLFVYNLCQQLDMDKRDLISFFQELRLLYGVDFCSQIEILNEVEKLFEHYAISKLDIKRLYRYLDKNVKKEDALIMDEEEYDE